VAVLLVVVVANPFAYATMVVDKSVAGASLLVVVVEA
jgi:hypothetical protein